MAIPPEDFISAAEAIRGGAKLTGEGRHRTMAGRAYYGLFWATCEATCKAHGIPTAQLPHETLALTLAGFKGTSDEAKRIRAFGNTLNSLRLLRVRSDYKLAKTVKQDETDDLVTDARVAFGNLPALTPHLPKVDPV